MGRAYPKANELSFIKTKDGRRYRLSSKIAGSYKTIANVLGLEQAKIDIIDHSTEYSDRVGKVLQEWLQNANQLPNDYPLTWDGLRQILIDSELANVATEFFEVLKDC